MGYDKDLHQLVVFGGETPGGLQYDKTHLLNFDTMVWSVPTPPLLLDKRPSGRSRAGYAMDLPAS